MHGHPFAEILKSPFDDQNKSTLVISKLSDEEFKQIVPDQTAVLQSDPGLFLFAHALSTRPRSAVGNVSGYRCVSDCRSRGREFDPGPVPYFRGD